MQQKEVLKKTMEDMNEIKEKTVRNLVAGWDDSYLEYNMLAGERDVTGKYQIHYDKKAEEMLAVEQAKATLGFPDKKTRMKFMIEEGYYREDLLRDGITLDNVEELYATFNKYDIGYTRFYSRFLFVNNFSYKVTDDSLFRKGLNKLITVEDRRKLDRNILKRREQKITSEDVGIELDEEQINLIDMDIKTALKTGEEVEYEPELVEKLGEEVLAKVTEWYKNVNEVTEELVKEVVKEEGIELDNDQIEAYVNSYKFGGDITDVREVNRLYTDGILKALGLTRKSLPTARYDGKYILMEDHADRTIAHSLDIVGGKPYTIEDVKASIKGNAMRTFQASTPSFANAGLNTGGQKISCAIIKIDDNLPSIRDRVGDTLMLSKLGAGIGIDGNDLRALGESVGDLDNRAHGAVKVAKMIEGNVQYADQDGKRVGSAVYNIDAMHMDFLQLLDSKKENVDESVRLSMLSIGLVVNDKLMDLFTSGEKGYYAFAPHTIMKEYGLTFTEVDMNEMYDELVSNPRVRKQWISFETLVDELGSAVSESGYPYILFRGNMTREHAYYNEVVAQSNLCTEIIQSLTSEQAIQCNLGSIDILNVMNNNLLKETITTLTRHLNGVMDNSDFSSVPIIEKGMKERRAIGIGTANLQGFFAVNGIPYESEEAIDFVRVFYSHLNYYSLKESNRLAKVYGKFQNFEETTYARGDYFDRYTEFDYKPVTDKVKEIFDKVGWEYVTVEDWKELKADVQEHGLANAYRLAIAPNGTTSYSMGGTAGISPNTQLIENRRTATMGSALYPMPGLEDPSTYFMYKDAYRINDFRYLDLIREIQNHIDQGISTTLFITDDYTKADWFTRVVYAHAIGIKTLYYTRPKIQGATELDNHEECESCAG